MKLFDLANRLWEMPQVPVINTLRPRSPLFTYPDEASAKAGSFEPFDCPAIQSLNGKWQFKYFETPDQVDEKLLYSTDAASRGWAQIAVPGCWSRQGYDRDQYCNVVMPFKLTLPNIPRDWNPTGLYRRVFEVRKGFERVVLHFGGIESCGLIYVNGKDVGMVKDSRTSSEFDVTDFVKPGKNLLTVLVLRFSDGTFLEDQDHWRMAGIFRDVYLQYTPKNYISDVFAMTTLEDGDTTGVMRLRCEAGFRETPLVPDGWSFSAQLYDMATGKAVLKEPVVLPFYRNGMACRPDHIDQPMNDILLKFPGIKRWSAETPNLYRLTVTLVNPEGKVVDATGADIGFKSVRLEKGCLMINGQPVRFFGVNRHDFDETTGKAVSFEDIRKDVTLMKRNNFNAIRTSHYPNDERLTALCNRYGLYVISECNLECHAYCYGRLTDDPQWMPGMLERMRRMVLIYKNNPCIHLWSLGNESGIGANFAAMASWARHYDTSRLVHYGEYCSVGVRDDGVTPVHNSHWTRIPNTHTDLVDTVSPMYPSFTSVEAWIKNCLGKETRPLIMCEYTHAMGNSNGALADYFEYFRKYPQIQGGYIWDWVDQAIAGVDAKTGKKTWLYGGDFGDVPNDYDFCGNGMVSADRVEHPSCQEFKYLARPFNFEPACLESGRFKLTNWNYFVKLDNVDFLWSIDVDGQRVQHGKLSRKEIDAIAPQTAGDVQCKYDLSQLEIGPDCQAFLNITAVQRKETPWAPAGFTIAWQQFEVTSMLKSAALSSANAEVCQGFPADQWQFANGTLAYGRQRIHFAEDGLPDSWSFDGKELLAGPVTELFGRGYTDNDGIRAWADVSFKDLCRWNKVLDCFNARKQIVLVPQANLLDNGVMQLDSVVKYVFKDGSELQVRRTIACNADGRMDLDVVFNVPESLKNLPRLAVVLPLKAGFENLAFYGCGPRETYVDRQAGGRIGLYQQSVTEQYFPYVMPQETGNHTKTDFVQLDDGLNGLSVSSKTPFEFSALHYTAREFWEARHIGELVPHQETFLTINARQCGLGTHSCGEGVLPKYQIGDGTYRLALTLMPVKL